MKKPLEATSLRRTLAANAAGPALAILVLSAIVLWQWHAAFVSSNWVTHTVLVQERVSQMDAALESSEAGLRGYLLTQRPDFRLEFERGHEQSESIAEEIEHLVADNPSQLNAIRRLRRLDPAWYRSARSEVDRQPVTSTGDAAVTENTSQMSELHGRLQAFLNEEARLLTLRQARLRKASALSVGLAVAAIVLLLAAFGLFGLRQLRVLNGHYIQNIRALERNKAELQALTDSLEHANRTLERRVQERTEELQQAYETCRQLASSDGLTGIPNRRSFDEFLNVEWRRCCRNQAPLSLLILDVDHFKAYNDALGHPAGDECLRRIAAVIHAAARRPGDLAARYGGEEFAVILSETDETGAVQLAEQIRSQVESLAMPHAGSRTASVVTMSIGVASVVPQLIDGAGSLIALADGALYTAKQQGRNSVREARAQISVDVPSEA